MAEKALIHAVSILAKEHVHVALSNHADYSGLLQLDGGKKALCRAWIHGDSSIGLRLEMLK